MIQRQLLSLDNRGGAAFFGEPALDIDDFRSSTTRARGYIMCSARPTGWMQSPKLYSTFLLWLLELLRGCRKWATRKSPSSFFLRRGLFDDAPKGFDRQASNRSCASLLQGRWRLFCQL